MITTSIDHIRIVIALAVVKNKPPNQGFLSYIALLKDSFPCLSSSESPNNFWKDHARQLEKECADLRAALGDLQIRSFLEVNIDQPKPSEVSVPSSSEGNSASTSVKKKNKKKADLNTGEKDDGSLAGILKFGRTGLGSGKLFEVLDTFLQLCLRHARPEFPRQAFFAATGQVFKALHAYFENAMKESTSLKPLRTLQIVLSLVIDRAVPLVIFWSIEDSEFLSLFFEHFLDILIIPIIPAFLALSERDLAYLHHADPVRSSKSGSATSSDYVDQRVGILALLQSALTQIQSSLLLAVKPASSNAADPGSAVLMARAHGDFSVLLLSLILAILRHLRGILEDDSETSIKPRPYRIKRLAIKDTLWYLSSAVHFLFELEDRVPCMIVMNDTESLESCWRTRVTLLKYAIQDISVELVLYQDRKRADAFTASPNQIGSEDAAWVHRDTDSGARKYVILDDLEYRMLLRLAERLRS